MPIFDITRAVLVARPQRNIYDRSRQNRFAEIEQWLVEYVGEYYGPGDDHTIAIGSGWEIFVLHNGKIPKPNSNEDAVVTFHVDITDEAKSTLFALKWIN